MGLAGFIRELRRRKVIQVTSVYVVTAWGASLGAAELLPAFGVPDWVVRAMVISFLLLLPVVVAMAWYFEFTTQGIVRDPHDIEQDRQQRNAETEFDPDIAGSVVEVTWEDIEGRKQQIFTNSLSIGRDAGCDLSTLDQLASRQHAEINHVDGVWWIEDLRSRNGTYLDGTRITRSKLPDRCIISLGEKGQKYNVHVFHRTSTTISADGGLRDAVLQLGDGLAVFIAQLALLVECGRISRRDKPAIARL